MRTLLLFIGLLTATAHAELIDGVVAIVNDKVITHSDLRDYVRPVIIQLQRNYSGPELTKRIQTAHMDALNNLIERHLILAEFKDKGYSFPETAIDEQLNDTIANDFGGDRAAFTKTLLAENLTLAKYREQLRDRMIVQAMRSRKTQNEVVVSPYKIETYYKEHLDKFREEDQVKLRMILVKKSPGTPEERRALADKVLAKLDAGESFDSVAKEHSEGSESQKGGEWGWVKRDELRKELSEVAFTLQPRQHSKLIETADGFYILQVDETRQARARALPEVRDIIEKELLQQQRAKMEADWVKQLRAKAYIRLF